MRERKRQRGWSDVQRKEPNDFSVTMKEARTTVRVSR